MFQKIYTYKCSVTKTKLFFCSKDQIRARFQILTMISLYKGVQVPDPGGEAPAQVVPTVEGEEAGHRGEVQPRKRVRRLTAETRA